MILKVHNTLASTDPSCAKVGPVPSYLNQPITFNAFLFGLDGMYDPNAGKSADFGSLDIGSTKFAVEFWLNPKTTKYGIYDFIFDGDYDIVFYIDPSGNLIVNVVPISGMSLYYRFTINDFSADDDVHFLINFDGTAGAILKCTVKQDNVPLTLNAVYVDLTWSQTAFHFAVSDNRADGYSGDKAIANLKVWDDNKADALDRFWEGNGVPLNVVASQGTFSAKTTVGWDAVIGVLTGYNIYRSTSDGGTYTLIGSVDGSTLSYDDTAGVSGVHYYYKVTSVTATAESEKSASAVGWREGLAPSVPYSGMAKITDYSVNLSLLLEQYKQSTNLKGILSVMDSEADDFEDCLFEIMNNYWLYSAEGVQLDVLGKIFNISRMGQSDADYRITIGNKATAYKSGEPETIISILKLFYLATYVYYRSSGPAVPAGYYLDTDANVTSEQLKKFSPAGVQLYLLNHIQDGDGNNLVDANGNQICSVA